jgi:hypothetical protein
MSIEIHQQKAIYPTGRGQHVSIEWQGSLLEIVPYLNREHPSAPDLKAKKKLKSMKTKTAAKKRGRPAS